MESYMSTQKPLHKNVIPSIENLKMYYDIITVVHSKSPTYSRLCLDMWKDKDKIDRVLKTVPDFVKKDVSVALFKKYLAQGFVTKEILETLFYEDFSINQKRSFYLELCDWKMNDLIIFCGHKDIERTIFKNKKTWYFLPPLIQTSPRDEKKVEKLEKSQPSDTLISYNLKTKNRHVLNWIRFILFRSCHEFSVENHGSFFSGTLHNVNIRILCDVENKSLQICLNGFNESAILGRDFMLLGIHSMITSHTILREFIYPVPSPVLFPVMGKKQF